MQQTLSLDKTTTSSYHPPTLQKDSSLGMISSTPVQVPLTAALGFSRLEAACALFSTICVAPVSSTPLQRMGTCDLSLQEQSWSTESIRRAGLPSTGPGEVLAPIPSHGGLRDRMAAQHQTRGCDPLHTAAQEDDTEVHEASSPRGAKPRGSTPVWAAGGR